MVQSFLLLYLLLLLIIFITRDPKKKEISDLKSGGLSFRPNLALPYMFALIALVKLQKGEGSITLSDFFQTLEV